MRLFSFRIVTVCLILAGIVGGCSPRPAAQQTQSNVHLLFASDRSGTHQYYLYTDGDLTPLSFNLPAGLSMTSPQWLPDKMLWLFTADDGTNSDIYTASPDGQTITNLTNAPHRFNGDPVISPDGKTIAFIAVELDLDVFVKDLLTGEEKNLTSFPSRDKSPVWIDNERLLFSSNQNGTPNIFTMKKDGSDLTDLTKGNGLDGNFSLSPSRDEFVFESDRDGSVDLFIYVLKTGEIKNITNTPGKDTSPLWSPGGDMIAFLSDRDGGQDVFIYEIKTGKTTNLTRSPDEPKIGLAWSPDNDTISYVTDGSGNLEVVTVSLTGEKKNISNNPAADYSASWVVK